MTAVKTIHKQRIRGEGSRLYTLRLQSTGADYRTPEKTLFVPWSDVDQIHFEGGDIYVCHHNREVTRQGLMRFTLMREAFANPAVAKRFYNAAVALWQSGGLASPPAELRAEFADPYGSRLGAITAPF